MENYSNSSIRTLFDLLRRLPSRRTRRFWIIFVGMLIVAVMETLTAGTIAFYAASIAAPDIILQDHLPRIQKYLPVPYTMTVRELMIFLSILVISVIAVKNLVMNVVMYASNFFSTNISGYLGESLLGGFLNMPYEWHLQHNSADLIQGVGWRQHFGRLISASLKALSDILIIVILLSALLIANPIISLTVVFVLLGVSLILFNRVHLSLDKVAEKHLDITRSINRQITRSIHGIKEVKIYELDRAFTRQYEKDVYNYSQLNARLQLLNQLPGSLLEICGITMLTLSICIMFFYFGDSTVKITGSIVLLAVTGWRVLPAASRILNNITQIRKSLPYVHSGFKFLDEIHAHNKTLPIEKNPSSKIIFHKQLQLNNVSFCYHGTDRSVLNDINLTIPKGKSVGIVGTSGAGKSTLVDIIIGLLKPAAGEILLDGNILNEISIKRWQKIIGYVPQSPYIAPCTLAENVAFGVPMLDIDRQQVLQCCTMAAMDDFLNTLPHGIDTNIGERGGKISGGQRQRVAIARALYHRPEVLIFDEATSALDKKNEVAIQKTMYSLQKNMTLIVIAHRLTTVEECDAIIWLENGKIRMMGDPSHVLKQIQEHNKRLT